MIKIFNYHYLCDSALKKRNWESDLSVQFVNHFFHVRSSKQESDTSKNINFILTVPGAILLDGKTKKNNWKMEINYKQLNENRRLETSIYRQIVMGQNG